MSKAKLFQYAVIWNPSEAQEEEGKKATLIVELTTVLASNEKSIGLKAAKAIPDEYDEELDQIDIVIKPF